MFGRSFKRCMLRHDGCVMMCGIRLACGSVKEEEEEEDCSIKV